MALASQSGIAPNTIVCIGVDWGTSNRRAWALDDTGRVMAARSDDQGLLAIKDRAFAESLRAFAGDWLTGGVPIVMAGMVGSRAGWREAQYLETPVDLTKLGGRLTEITDFAGNAVRIVPGAARNEANGADVMRGEECQMLGALLTRGLRDGVFNAVKSFIELHSLLPKGVKLMPEDVFARASFVLSAKVLDPQFQGQIKERLNSRDAVRLVSSFAKPPLELWLNSHVELGKKLAELHPNIVVKVPMTRDGVKAIKYFSGKGIKTNCTLVFSAGQALLAAKAGASFTPSPMTATR